MALRQAGGAGFGRCCAAKQGLYGGFGQALGACKGGQTGQVGQGLAGGDDIEFCPQRDDLQPSVFHDLSGKTLPFGLEHLPGQEGLKNLVLWHAIARCRDCKRAASIGQNGWGAEKVQICIHGATGSRQAKECGE